MILPEIMPPLDHLDELSPEQLGLVIVEELVNNDMFTKEPDIQLIESCINAGANLEVFIRHVGQTPLHYAVSWAKPDVVKLLLDGGANLEARTRSHDYTPLHLAAAGALRNTTSVLKILLESGASKEAGDFVDRTPWDLASKRRRHEFPELKP